MINLKTIDLTNISDSDLASLLNDIEELKAYIENIKQEALNRLKQGRDIQGWEYKVRAGVSSIKDESSLITIAKENSIPVETLYEQKLLTVAKIKTLWKTNKVFIGALESIIEQKEPTEFIQKTKGEK